MPASELKELEENAKAYDAALQSANLRPLTFTLKVAEDTYNDETRIKKSVNRQACCPSACAGRSDTPCHDMHGLDRHMNCFHVYVVTTVQIAADIAEW